MIVSQAIGTVLVGAKPQVALPQRIYLLADSALVGFSISTIRYPLLS